MNLQIPYGDTHLSLCLPDANLRGVLASNLNQMGDNEKNQDETVFAAMASPIGSPTLKELAAGKKKATVIISDHTRPVPSQYILPHMLSQLKAGSPGIDITLLVATGFHRATTSEELIGKLGEKISSEEKIIIHNSRDRDSNVTIGVLPSGAPLVIDRAAVETDLLISEGFIEPHFFAGFSGGRKSVLPGVCDQATVLGNHCSRFIASPCARTGNLIDNPIQKDMEAAARMANLRYIVNVVIDEEKRVAAAFAGDPFKAHEEGCRFIKSYCRVDPVSADIVITSNGGAPLDQNIYQAVKGLSAAEATAADGAVIVLCARCDDGVGGEDFYRALRDCETPRALLDEVIKVPMDQTLPDQWQYQILARILAKHHVIFVTNPALEQTVKDMKMEYAESLDRALERAFAIKGSSAGVTVIPNGVSVIVESK